MRATFAYAAPACGGWRDTAGQGDSAAQLAEFVPVELPDSRQVRVQRLYPKTVLKPAVRTMLVPVPKTAPIGGQPVRDTQLLAWCGEVIQSVLADLPAS